MIGGFGFFLVVDWISGGLAGRREARAAVRDGRKRVTGGENQS